MAALDLPAHNAELFARVRGPLAEHLGGERHLCLGGGTALAARWNHRHSTDLDFFVDAAAYRGLYTHARAFERDLAHAAGGISASAISSGSATVVLADGGEMSISTTPARTANPRSGDTIRESAVAIESTEEVLARKIGGRILSNNIFVPRDLYDITVARHYDPVALDRALRLFSTDERRQIAEELAALPRDWLARQPRALVNPARPLAAERCVEGAREIIAPPRALHSPH